jgi:CRISPR-associated exonuclease Cas4
MTSFYLALAILLVAILLLIVAGRQRRAAGLPGGRIVYTDTQGWGRVEKPLYDAELDLTGKPDYLVEKDGKLIPVEVKTGRTPEAPYDSHIFQLASYCYLVEKTFGKRPPYGLIHYSGRDFAVDYTPELESALLDLLARIRLDERRRDIHRSHEHEHRCRGCGFREMCDERLT